MAAQDARAEEVEDGQPAEDLDDEPGHAGEGDGDADEDEAQQGGEERPAS